MADCLLTGGIDIDCQDLKSVGGVDKAFYITSRDNIVSYELDAEGYVKRFTLSPYTNMYKFVSVKRAHNRSTNLVVQAGANKLFEQVFVAKLFATSPADDDVIENLAVVDTVIFHRDNNSRWYAVGLENGLELTAYTQASGNEAATDTTDTLTFTGQEPKKPYRLNLDGGNQNFLEYLTA
jgi:hypothetical protein